MTLTEVSQKFRHIGKWLFLFAVVYYGFYLFLIPQTRKVIDKFRPPKYPDNPIYGQLEPLEFETVDTNDSKPTYSLNTKGGRLPLGFPKNMPVFTFGRPAFSYLASANALKTAEYLGFSKDELTSGLKGNIYRWKSLKSEGTLEIDINTRRTILNTKLYGKGNLYKEGSIDKRKAETVAKKLLAILRINDLQYKEAKVNVILGKFTRNILTRTNSETEAQLARVDFIRYIDKYPILGPDPTKGLIHAWLRNPTESYSPYNYPKIEAYYHKINTKTQARYPIINVYTAWEAVKNGKGVIVNVTPKESNPFREYVPTRVESIIIDKIYLAYYETPQSQNYLQPIYVFSGKYTTRGTTGGSIKIYLPAISGDYIKHK